VQIDVRRLDRFMTEPERDDGRVDPASKQVHGTGVAEHMRGHRLRRERRLMVGRQRGVVVEETLEGIRAEASAVARGKEQIVSSAAQFCQPAAKHLERLPSERRATFLTALAMAANVRARVQMHITAAEGGQLRLTQAGLSCKE